MGSLTFFICSIVVILFTITIHEYAHGKTAELFGDPTPRMSGRLSLNPIVHIDPIGFLMLIIVRFGWAKPVPINPNYFKDPDKDMAIVALAGPATNFFAAWIVSLVIKFVPFPAGEISAQIIPILQFAVWINIALAIFNLIPIPPLDGSRLLRALVPYGAAQILDSLEQFGFVILVFLLLFPGTSTLIIYLVDSIYKILL
jgi:Zn-dependent protease